MNYELVKQLKEAGFSQTPWPESLFYFTETIIGVWGSFNKNIYSEKREILNYDSFVKRPTLSELIEACGDIFGAVYKAHDDITIDDDENVTCRDVWEAVDSSTFHLMQSPKFPKSYSIFSGSTPEEAVSRLWLQLNSQPK